MMLETKQAIARNVARYLIKNFGEEIENLTYSEVLEDEVPGVDEDLFEELIELTRAYVQVANVEVYFQEWRIRDDGTVMTEKEVEQQKRERYDVEPEPMSADF